MVKKRYKVTFKQNFTIYVEAENKEEAEKEAWDFLWQDSDFDPYDYEVKVVEVKRYEKLEERLQPAVKSLRNRG
jgi:hypothetical protein